MDRIANDFKMPCRTHLEKAAVFDRVMSMTSWNNKACCPKTSRWFSWVEASHEQLGEFWGSKMILEAYLVHQGLDDDDHDDDDAAEHYANPSDSEVNLKKLREAGNGGLQLVYKCLTYRVWEDASIISRVGQVLWTCYTEHLLHVKSASDQVAYSVSMAQGWMKCGELQGLAQLLSGGLADLFEWCIDEGEAAQKALSYVVHLMGNRASSLSKHGAPPHCYANVLESHGALHGRDVKRMKWDWKSLVSLELSGIDDGGLAEDLRICIDAPTRIMLQCFEMADWCQSHDDNQVDLEPALDILKCIIQKPPDTKAVEDLHQRLRMKTKDRANEKITPTCCQHVVNTSNVIDSRHVGHPWPSCCNQPILILQFFQEDKVK